jgi:hypothetical protein
VDASGRPRSVDGDALRYHVSPRLDDLDRLLGVKASEWAGRDSNPRRRQPADLQSAPIVRSGTDPRGR